MFQPWGIPDSGVSVLDLVASTFIWGAAWTTTTGAGDTAVEDGGKFSSRGGTSNRLSVVSASGLGFPAGMTNVLRIEMDGLMTHQYDQIYTHGVYSDLPAVGEYGFFRWFMRLDAAANQTFGAFHPIHFGDGNNGPLDIEVIKAFNTDGTGAHYEHKFGPFHDLPAYPYDAAWLGNVGGGGKSNAPVSVTFCQEIRLQRNSSTTVKVAFQQSLVDGSSQTGTSSWGQDNNVWSTGNPDISFASSSFTDLVLGNNDYNNPGVGYLYFGGFAFKKSTNSTAWFGVSKDASETWT